MAGYILGGLVAVLLTGYLGFAFLQTQDLLHRLVG